MIGRILIADDETDLRENMGSYLARRGFEIELAEDGVAALERLRARPFDAAVLDVDMPRKTGLEVLAIVRRESPRTSIVLMTANVARVEDLLRREAVSVLVKPFDLARLAEMLLHVVQKTATAGP